MDYKKPRAWLTYAPYHAAVCCGASEGGVSSLFPPIGTAESLSCGLYS